MKIGELVIAGINGEDDNILGVVLEECPPEKHKNGILLVHVLHSGFMKWWPATYVRKINESR